MKDRLDVHLFVLEHQSTEVSQSEEKQNADCMTEVDDE